MAVPYQMQRQPFGTGNGNSRRSYATQINSNCRCEAVIGGACPAGQQHLRWTWTSAGMSSYWDGCLGFCNPMNCSNSACSTKGCANARNVYCSQHGKLCGNVRKCFGPQGQDPCPGSGCNKTTDDAVNKVIAYIIGLCHPNCGNCIFERDFLNGALKTGYPSGLESIRQSLCTGANIGGMSQAAFIAKVGNAVRCSFIEDKTFANCRGGCPGGTCNGKKCGSGSHLNANNCHCDPDKDPLTDWFGSWCHVFDFLPWGGCTNQNNTLLFIGGVVILAFVLFKRV